MHWLRLLGILLWVFLLFKIPWLAGVVALLIVWWWLKRKFQHRAPEPGEGEFGPIRDELKDAVWEHQGGRCAVNGCDWTKTMNCHHIKHREDGGDNRLSNLIYLCPNHHTEIHLDTRRMRAQFRDAMPTPVEDLL